MSGENGPGLEQYVETRFNLLLEQLKAESARVDSRFTEIDLRYRQRFDAQMEATTKADVASENRFASVNEFRKTLTDQTATFVPRTEANQLGNALSERISKLEAQMAAREARISGALEDKTSSRSDFSVWITAGMMIISIAALIVTFIRK